VYLALASAATQRKRLEQELLSLLSARKGHFRLESGYHGGLWLDLDPLFVTPGRVRPFVERLAERLSEHRIEAVCGPLVGGAFLAHAIASLLDIEFYYARRFVPTLQDEGTLYPVDYRLPSGVSGLVRDKAVAVVDDAISAGSAVRGTVSALESRGARVAALGALLMLGSQAQDYCRDREYALEAIVQLPYEMWVPAECPMCASGLPLEDMGGSG
jgi:orotate phosphoribosyltransferase